MRAAIVGALLMVFTPATFATLCIRPSPEQVFARADFIFEATVEMRREVDDGPTATVCWTDGERCGPKIATLRVQRIWKGDPGDQVTIRSEDACYCLGTYLFTGERYIVFGTRASGDGYDMDDMGACATESLASAQKRGFIDALNALAAR